ncbi:MAG: hypothetical protein ACLTSZ_11715 [Lachnospiraceae bacterium]
MSANGSLPSVNGTIPSLPELEEERIPAFPAATGETSHGGRLDAVGKSGISVADGLWLASAVRSFHAKRGACENCGAFCIAGTQQQKDACGTDPCRWNGHCTCTSAYAKGPHSVLSV